MKQIQSYAFAPAYEYESIEPFLANAAVKEINSAIVAEAMETMNWWATDTAKVVDVPADLTMNTLDPTAMAEGLFFMDRVES